jgi:hypothetical protein
MRVCGRFEVHQIQQPESECTAQPLTNNARLTSALVRLGGIALLPVWRILGAHFSCFDFCVQRQKFQNQKEKYGLISTFNFLHVIWIKVHTILSPSV